MKMKFKRLPVGISDFKDVVTGKYYYVDKTLFIKEIIDKGNKVLLIPRPRRFGKTLNLSMVGYFYDCCPEEVFPDDEGRYPSNKNDMPRNSYKALFKSFAIRKAGTEYRKKMGKHPVIYLSFRSLKDSDWETCLGKIKYLIKSEYLKHKYLLSSPKLEPEEKDYFKKIIESRGDKGDYENSLQMLMIYLSRFYEERVVILIDEYDTPVHAGYYNDYYEIIIGFMRNFLCAALKDTDKYLEKSVITGILRIAKESIFSGLNNPGIFTLTADEFSDGFGFTEKEIETLLTDFNLLDLYNDIRKWYNGYMFGGKTIYNPWSIISLLESNTHELQPYWINTSDNKLVEILLSKGGKELKEELEQLIRGESIEKYIDDNIVMRDISTRDDLLWSFLLMSGYLKYTDYKMNDSQELYYTLSIPNFEVKFIYRNIIRNYFSSKMEARKLDIMLKALIEGDVVLFEEKFQDLVALVFSYHDFGGEPEKVYHAFVTGLLVWISGTHEVRSNRESGYGRYDIMVIPGNPAQTGYVIEFKSVNKRRGETVQAAIESALLQIEEKRYEMELIERGIRNIKKLAIVFDGKDVCVKESQSHS